MKRHCIKDSIKFPLGEVFSMIFPHILSCTLISIFLFIHWTKRAMSWMLHNRSNAFTVITVDFSRLMELVRFENWFRVFQSPPPHVSFGLNAMFLTFSYVSHHLTYLYSLTVFRPRPAVELTRPDSDESVEENLLEMNDSDQRQVEMRSAGSGVSENAAEAVARSEPDFNDYVNWVDSVQVTITAADVTALTNTVQVRFLRFLLKSIELNFVSLASFIMLFFHQHCPCLFLYVCYRKSLFDLNWDWSHWFVSCHNRYQIWH